MTDCKPRMTPCEGKLDDYDSSAENSPSDVTRYRDSDWTSPDRRSTTGYYFDLNEKVAAILWKSKKQYTIAMLSCEAEYMTLTAATQEALFLKMLTNDFGIADENPILIHGDNQGSLDLESEEPHY